MSGKVFKEEQKEKVRIAARCEKCRKEITSESKAGSFTSFLFAANRCSCDKPMQLKVVSSATAATPAGASLTESLHIGDKPDLGERYEVLSLIGQGGMGAVWKVRDTAIDKTLAVKVLRKELATDRFALKRFEQEAQAASCLTQANLVAVYGSGLARDNSPYLIMDYLDGESLEDRLQREVYLPVPEVLDISTQICEALAHAHAKGIVHRDLKPSNIMLTKSADGNDIVKIVDFGIAKLMPSIKEQTHNLTQTGDLFGSPLYMSPEQCTGEQVDARSDIYSLGCVMYEMLTGKAGFSAANPIKTILMHINDQPAGLNDGSLPKELASLISICLDKDPSKRYQGCDSLLQDLELVGNGELPSALKRSANFPHLLNGHNAWRRFCALCVDGFVVGLLGGVLQFAVVAFFINYLKLQPSAAVHDQSSNLLYALMGGFLTSFIDAGVVSLSFIEMIIGPAALAMTSRADKFIGISVIELLYVTMVVINWLYHALMESSDKKATLGKILFGLKVVNEQNQKISFGQATARHFSKIVSLAGLTDMFWVPLSGMFFGSKGMSGPSMFDSFCRRPLHDRISGSYIVGSAKTEHSEIGVKQAQVSRFSRLVNLACFLVSTTVALVLFPVVLLSGMSQWSWLGLLSSLGCPVFFSVISLNIFYRSLSKNGASLVSSLKLDLAAPQSGSVAKVSEHRE